MITPAKLYFVAILEVFQLSFEHFLKVAFKEKYFIDNLHYKEQYCQDITQK